MVHLHEVEPTPLNLGHAGVTLQASVEGMTPFARDRVDRALDIHFRNRQVSASDEQADTTGAVSGYVASEPVATNMVAMAVTSFVPVFFTNVVQVPVTNLVAGRRRQFRRPGL